MLIRNLFGFWIVVPNQQINTFSAYSSIPIMLDPINELRNGEIMKMMFAVDSLKNEGKVIVKI